MTKYCYAEEMYKLCYKMSQILKVLGEHKLSRFYNAAADGFIYRQKILSVRDANKPASKEMVQDLHDLTKYLKKKEALANEKLDKEAI